MNVTNNALKQADESIKVARAATEEATKNPTIETSQKADEAGRRAKKAAASTFRAAEELSRKAELAELAGDEAIVAASKVSGLLAEKVEEAGNEAKESTSKGFEVAEKALKTAEEADTAGDEAIAAATASLDTQVKRAEELARQADEKAEHTIKADMIPKIVREVLSSRQFLLIILMVVLGTLFASVAISAGLVSLGP